MPVRILEEHVVNQIAAGEVVERPASVVRELLQNSLDAGATTLEIGLRNGGMALIRIVDDGSGMNRTDAMMALERHATSKIHRAEDLQHIGTLGFRGEALPSIAAVSRFELRTRLHDEEAGTRIRIDGGTLRDVSEIGCAPGTEIDVRSLFFNLPARRKFLRTRTTELNHCLAAVIREVLLRPELDVVVRHEDREVLRAPRAGDLGARVAAILGDSGKALLDVDVQHGPVQVVGRIAPVGVHRSTAASSVYLYVNGRYVQDRLLRRSVYEAYRGKVPRGRYPVVVLDVRVDPLLVDVNVHPTKTEVRFTHPRQVSEAVSATLRGLVDDAGASLIRRDPTLGTVKPGPLFAPAPEPLPLESRTSADSTARPATPPPAKDPLAAHPDDDPTLPKASVAATPPTDPLPGADTLVAADRPAPRLQEGATWRGLAVLGDLAGRYLLCTRGPTLVVVDLEAAHRVLWTTRARAGQPPLGPSQRLLAPARVQLTRSEADRVEQATEALAALGVDVDRFGPLEIAVRGLPQELGPLPPATLVAALARTLVDTGETGLGEALSRIAATHHPLPTEPHERRTLLATLDEAGVPVGPPIRGRWTVDELARRTRGSR